jgi:hypothetical protein
MDDQQRKRFQAAVKKKSRRAKADSEDPSPPGVDISPGTLEQQSLVESGRPQDTQDPRKKNTGHRKKTADKWNQ